jgi:two-component system chemotaxis response regulator CheB
MPIKVLIVDDSAFIRAILTQYLKSAPGIEIVGAVNDPVAAVDKIRLYDPDVITLDLEMPKMDGLTFLQHLMQEDPRPVVMISSWTAKDSEAYIKALAYGAFDCINKPTLGMKEGMEALKNEIISKVIQAARTKHKMARLQDRSAERKEVRPIDPTIRETSEKVIAIGASTGGTVAITEILRRLPADLPGILIVQHMPAFFTPSFASSLNQQTSITVKEASGRERINRGGAWLAPGGWQMKVEKDGAVYVTRVIPAQPNELHKPSVDVTFHSVAECVGANALGILLTGMGEDGAWGLRAMRDVGAWTIAQDEATSVVYGMPGKAAEIGAAEKILPLPMIADEIVQWARRQRRGV